MDDDVTQEFAESFAPAHPGHCSLYLISPQEVGGNFPDRLKAALGEEPQKPPQKTLFAEEG